MVHPPFFPSWMAITGCKWQVLARYFLTSGSWWAPKAAGLDMLEELLSCSHNKVTSWPFKYVLCTLEVKWSACYILPESPKIQTVIQLGAANVLWKLNVLHKAHGQLGRCCDGCCVSHQHVETSDTWVVANNFTDYWNNMAQNRHKRRLRHFYFKCKWIFALLCEFCLYVNFSFFGVHFWAVVLYYNAWLGVLYSLVGFQAPWMRMFICKYSSITFSFPLVFQLQGNAMLTIQDCKTCASLVLNHRSQNSCVQGDPQGSSSSPIFKWMVHWSHNLFVLALASKQLSQSQGLLC